jgi:hypothetical protein
MQSKLRIGLWGALVIVLASNIVILAWRFSQPSTGATGGLRNTPQGFQVNDPRHSILADWHSQPSTAIHDYNAVREALESKDIDSTCDLRAPIDCKAVNVSDLTKGERDDLQSAIAGLLVAYRQNTADALIEYMSSRGQILNHAMMSRKREFVVEMLKTDNQVPPMTDEEVFESYWQYWGYDPAWAGFLANRTCTIVYSCGRDKLDMVKANGSLSRVSKTIWRNAKPYPHHFSSNTGSVDREIEEHEHVLIADVVLVVVHSEKIYGQRSPYFLRFWFDTGTTRWNPLLMSRCRIDQFRDDGVKILF